MPYQSNERTKELKCGVMGCFQSHEQTKDQVLSGFVLETRTVDVEPVVNSNIKLIEIQSSLCMETKDYYGV